MRKYTIVTLVLILAIVAGVFLSGCVAPGRTKAEVHRNHYDRFQHDSWQFQDDVDAVFMIDRPGRLSDKMVR